MNGQQFSCQYTHTYMDILFPSRDQFQILYIVGKNGLLEGFLDEKGFIKPFKGRPEERALGCVKGAQDFDFVCTNITLKYEPDF